MEDLTAGPEQPDMFAGMEDLTAGPEQPDMFADMEDLTAGPEQLDDDIQVVGVVTPEQRAAIARQSAINLAEGEQAIPVHQQEPDSPFPFTQQKNVIPFLLSLPKQETGPAFKFIKPEEEDVIDIHSYEFLENLEQAMAQHAAKPVPVVSPDWVSLTRPSLPAPAVQLQLEDNLLPTTISAEMPDTQSRFIYPDESVLGIRANPEVINPGTPDAPEQQGNVFPVGDDLNIRLRNAMKSKLQSAKTNIKAAQAQAVAQAKSVAAAQAQAAAQAAAQAKSVAAAQAKAASRKLRLDQEKKAAYQRQRQNVREEDPPLNAVDFVKGLKYV